MVAGKKLAQMLGRDVTDDEAARISLFVHRSLGVMYGVAAALVRAGARPFRSGVMTGTTAFFLVDEGVISVAFTPPPRAYPVESHLRGVVGHLAYGVAAGAMLTIARWLGAMKTF